MKFLLHGFGSYPVVFYHLIEAAKRMRPDIGWAIILPTPHHLELMRKVLPAEDIFSLYDHLSRRPQLDINSEALHHYPGNIFADIEAEKRAFKHRPASEQLARATEIYRIYQDFLSRSKATHLVIPQIESFEGRLLPGLAKKMGIEPMVATGGRMLPGTFFSDDAHESPPKWRRATPAAVETAEAFLARFRSAGAAPAAPAPADADDPTLDDFVPPTASRAWRFIRRSMQRRDLFEREYLRISLLNNLPAFRDTLWHATRRNAERYFDIADVEDLPPRFIYYPLQVTPESSINSPAPYFVDQLRAIDALRFAMPSDHFLVVKEHPAGITTRSVGFIQTVRRRAGVLVINYLADSVSILKRAALTVSVTGTATMEAFLLGRPSLTLGPSLISDYLGGVCPVHELPHRIRSKSNIPVSNQDIVRAIAELSSIMYDFVLRTPGTPGEPTLRKRNIERMLAAVIDYAKRSGSAKGDAAL